VHVPLLLFVGLQLGKEHGSRPGADVDDPPAIGVQEGQEGVRDAARSAGVGVEDFGGGRSVGEAGAGVVDYGVELLGGAQFLGEGLGGGCDGGWVADVLCGRVVDSEVWGRRKEDNVTKKCHESKNDEQKCWQRIRNQHISTVPNEKK